MLKKQQEESTKELEDFYDARRNANVRREEQRWDQMEQQEQRIAEVEQNCAESRSRKNAGRYVVVLIPGWS